MKILILCTGNSCRSQMAQAFLQSFDKRLEVHSAGTEPAEKINARAVEVLMESGINITGRIPQSVERYLSESWDYVITVCDHARETCPVFPGRVKHRLHIGFDDPSQASGTPEYIDHEFHRVRDEIRDSFFSFYKESLLPELNQDLTV